MAARDFPLNQQTLQAWEQGRYKPEPLAAKALETFLSQYPTITDAPLYGKRSKLSPEDLAEIRRLRAEGQTLVSIAGSYISHIMSGARLAIVTP
jgi:hypothetical protein